MKMKRILSLAFVTLFICFIPFSCSDDDSVAPTYVNELPSDLNAPYIVMKIDGKWWVADGNKLKKNEYDMSTRKFSNADRYNVSISSKSSNNFSKDQEILSITFDLPDEVAIQNYSLHLLSDDPYSICDISIGQWVKITDGTSRLDKYATNTSGTELPFDVEITAIHPDGTGFKNISGAFSGALKKEDGTIVKITEGKFVWQ